MLQTLVSGLQSTPLKTIVGYGHNQSLAIKTLYT